MQQRKANGKRIPEEALRRGKRARAALSAFVVLTVAVAIGVFAVVSAAVSRFGWKVDLTEGQVFRLTDATKEVLEGLDQTVELIYCNSVNSADSNIKEILNRYEAASPYIDVTYMDLAANPSTVEEWAGRNITLSSDGVLVQSGANARFIQWSDLYSLNTYTDDSGTLHYTLAGIQAETKLTSAILTVTTQEQATVAFTAGHSEDVPQGLSDLVSNGGYNTEQVVLGVQELGDDVTTVIIAGPKRDFSDKELQLLDDFMAGGGHLIVFRDPEVAELPNLDGYLEAWGIHVEDQIVLEPSQQLDSPLNIIPVFGVSMINVYFSETSTYLVLPECRALSLDNPNGCLTTTVLRSTSSAYGKDYAAMTTLAQSSGDSAGPFVVGATSERSYTDDDGESQTQYVFVVACTGFYQDEYLSTESLGNADLVLQVLAYMNDRDATLNIPVKSLSANDIVISRGAVTAFAAVFVAAAPLALLAAGAAVFLKRRHS